jgi:hypothetical protein
MPGGLTRKFDYEKGKRQAGVHKEDYRERILEEGDNFDRGGIEKKSAISGLKIRGNSLIVNLKPLYMEDKQSLIRTMERNWRFVIDGETGSICKLLNTPKVASRVSGLFEIMKRSILRADEIIDVAEHPKTKRKFYVVEFRCNIRPETPLPDPIFKSHLAFSPKLVGPAISGA